MLELETSYNSPATSSKGHLLHARDTTLITSIRCCVLLQALCADMRLNGRLDLATKQAMLNWTDEEGRTALMWAAQKNHLHVAQLVGAIQQ